MFGKLLMGFGIATMLSAMAMAGLAGPTIAVSTATPFWVFAGGAFIALLGGKITEAGRARRRAGDARPGMWSARE